MQEGHLSVICAAFDIFCVFVQGVDVVKEVDLGKNVKSLTLNFFLSIKHYVLFVECFHSNITNEVFFFTFGGNSVRSMHGVGSGFS